jgi:MATE family multidrug resistance protein
VRLTFATTAVWQGAVGLAYVGLPELLFAPFLSGAHDRAALREVGVRFLTISAAWQLFDAATTTLAEALRAAGDTAFTMWARVLIGWLLFAPAAYLSVRHLGWGERGASLSLVGWIAILAVVLFLRFRSGVWRRIQLTEPAP